MQVSNFLNRQIIKNKIGYGISMEPIKTIQTKIICPQCKSMMVTMNDCNYIFCNNMDCDGWEYDKKEVMDKFQTDEVLNIEKI